MEDIFEISKRNMENLLSSLEVADLDIKPKYALIVPKNHPSLIARGSNALIFELPPVKINEKIKFMVGKIFKYAETSTLKTVPINEIHAIGKPSGYFLGNYGVDITIYWLKQIIPNLKIPKMKEFHNSIKGVYLTFKIMPDLRQGGVYKIEEVNEGLLQKLRNRVGLKKEYQDLCSKIEKGVKNKNLILNPAGHGCEEDILPAIEHMFLIQYDKNNIGKLIAGDINHFSIYEKGHQFGVIPKYLKE